MLKTTALCLTLLAPVAALAQPPAAPPVPEAMKKLSWLAGTWKGDGWIQMGPERHTFTSSETVESRLDGRVLVIEGVHEDSAPGTESAPPVHHALGVLFWDEAQQKLRFQAHNRGRFLDAEAALEGEGFRWGFKEPRSGREMRYLISRDGEGRWTERGESSADGKDWRPFFEMTLRKAN